MSPLFFFLVKILRGVNWPSGQERGNAPLPRVTPEVSQ